MFDVFKLQQRASSLCINGKHLQIADKVHLSNLDKIEKSTKALEDQLVHAFKERFLDKCRGEDQALEN